MATYESPVKIVDAIANAPTVGFTGMLLVDQATGYLYYWNGSAWTLVTASGSSNYAFKTINCDNGSDPVADSTTDTLNLVSGTGITVTGDSSSDTATFAFSGVACVAYNSTTFTHNSTGNYVQLTWDTDIYDPHGFHSTSSNTGRLTVPSGKGGVYIVNAFTQWDTNTTGTRSLAIDHYNAAGIRQRSARSNSNALNGLDQNTTGFFYAAATDYFVVTAFQNSGANRTIDANTGPSDNSFSCCLVQT